MVPGLVSELFRYDDLCLRVATNEPAHLTWLQEVLPPHFRPGAGFPPTVVVKLIADSERYRRSYALAGRSLPAFALDSEVVRLPILEGPPGMLVIANNRHRVVYEVAEDRSAVCVIVECRDVLARSGILPVVREFAMNEAAARGDFFMHASCFVSGGRPVVVAGPRNSGKTTLLAFACLFAGADVLVNDRLRIGLREGRCTLGGVPTIITLRPRTLDFFPALGRRIRAEGLHANLTSDEQLDQTFPGPPFFPGVVTVSPRSSSAGCSGPGRSRRPWIRWWSSRASPVAQGISPCGAWVRTRLSDSFRTPSLEPSTGQPPRPCSNVVPEEQR